MAVHPSSSVAAARQVIADRLREMLRDAGITSRELARRAGWDESKCSRLIHGRTPPSDDDIRTWCVLSGVPEEIPNLIAATRNAENAYVEWRRVQRSQKHMQDVRRDLHQENLYRIYSSNVIPWPAQSMHYMRAVMTRFNEFHAAEAQDIEAGVIARMQRLRLLDDPARRCVMVIEESVLRGRIFDDEVMTAQLRHMMAMMDRPNISLGIIPLGTPRIQKAAETFHIYGDSAVSIELISAIISITQPHEVALYVRCFNDLASASVHGDAARYLIATAITALT